MTKQLSQWMKESADEMEVHAPTSAIAARGRSLRLRRRIAIGIGSMAASLIFVAGAVAVPNLFEDTMHSQVRPAAAQGPPPHAIDRERLAVVDNTATNGRSIVVSLRSGEEEDRTPAGAGLMIANGGSSLVRAYFGPESRSMLDVTNLETGRTSGDVELPGSLPGYMGGTYQSTLTASPDGEVAFIQLAQRGEARSDGSVPFEYVIATIDLATLTVRDETMTLEGCGAESFLVATGSSRVAAVCPEASSVIAFDVANDGSAAGESRIPVSIPNDDRSDENGNPLDLDRLASAVLSQDLRHLTVFSQNGSASVVDLEAARVTRRADLGLSDTEYLTLSHPSVDPGRNRAFFGLGDIASFDRLQARELAEVELDDLTVTDRISTGTRFAALADYVHESLVYYVDASREQVKRFDVDAERPAGGTGVVTSAPSYLIMTGE